MPVITAIYPARRRPHYLEMEIDGAPVGALPERELARLGLAVGQSIDPVALEGLRATAALAAALSLANGYLAHRPRSEAEVRRRLAQAGFDALAIDAAVEALTAQGLLDDTRFAALWVESRSLFSPRSAQTLGRELRQKGVDRDQIDAVLASSGTDDAALALDAGRKRLRSYGSLDEAAFRQKMSGYLMRRGFGYDVVRAAVELLWAEQGM